MTATEELRRLLDEPQLRLKGGGGMTEMERVVEEVQKAGIIMVDAEPIVRCKDCKYRADRGRRHYCDAHAGGFFEVAPDDFCAWGERTEGRP